MYYTTIITCKSDYRTKCITQLVNNEVVYLC